MARLTGASYVKVALALLLAAALFAVAGLGAGCSGWHLRFGGDTETGNAAIAASDVKNIEIDWAAGSVQLHVVDTDSDDIELIETGSGLTKAQEMRWKVSGDTLFIDYGGWLSCFSWGSKELEIRVPQKHADSFGLVSIDGASGYYNVTGIGCDRLDVDLASGELAAASFVTGALDIDVASGKAHADGVVSDAIRAHAASGRIEIVGHTQCPRSIDADMASGTIAVSVPENDGFTAYVDKASGSFESQFEVSQRGNVYVYGNGAANFDIDMASGRFILGKTAS